MAVAGRNKQSGAYRSKIYHTLFRHLSLPNRIKMVPCSIHVLIWGSSFERGEIWGHHTFPCMLHLFSISCQDEIVYDGSCERPSSGFTQSITPMVIYLDGVFSRVWGWCEGRIVKDIQSLCRYVRKMKDVFKELKVFVEKGKVALHKLTKMCWKRFLTIFTSTSKF